MKNKKGSAQPGFNLVYEHKTWSPSRLGCWEECPAKAKYKYLMKLPDPPGPALLRGTQLHTGCENYIRGVEKKLNPELAKAKKILDLHKREFAKGNVRVEMDLAFTQSWDVCDWMASDVWARFKVDAVLRTGMAKCVITDWKTGKFKPDGEYDEQLRLYCVALLSYAQQAPTTNSWAAIEEATAQLFFTDVGEAVRRPNGVLAVKGLVAERNVWNKKVERMFKDRDHEPMPGQGCRYCPFSIQKSGPCKF